MITMLKYFMAFLVSFSLLSIPVFDGRPLFYTLDKLLHPYTQKAINTTGKFSKKYLNEGLGLVKKTFSNSVPNQHDSSEDYKEKEIRELENLLKDE